MNKPLLSIIQSTDFSLEGLRAAGLLERHKSLLVEYSKTFDVVLYTSDEVDHSDTLSVKHHPVPWLPRSFAWRHLVFYLWLVWQAPRIEGVIKVFGSNIPILPFVRLLSRRRMMVTYQYDYAEVTRRNETSGLKHLLPPLMVRLALCSADLVLVTAIWLQEKVENSYHKKTVLLPNWVDVSALDRADADKSSDCDTILYCGRLHWSKGVSLLLDAFALISCHYPNAKLVVCGDGEEMGPLRKQLARLNVGNVCLRGSIPNEQVLKLMRSSSIFVLPSLTMEGHPKALIEAMAAGLACIATDVPGNRHLIVNRKNGLLVPAGDSRALSLAMNDLLAQPEFRRAIGANARANALYYDFHSVVPREVETLLALFEGREPSRPQAI